MGDSDFQKFSLLDYIGLRSETLPKYGESNMTIHEEALAARVRETLNMDKRISNLPISVRVTDSIIFLKGTVDTAEQLETVKFLIDGIAGVQHINVDELEIRETS